MTKKKKKGAVAATTQKETQTRDDPWIVKAGSTVLTRGTNEPTSAWRHERLDKVTYFDQDELIARPKRSVDSQIYVFKKGNKVYAIDDYHFLAMPPDDIVPFAT